MELLLEITKLQAVNLAIGFLMQSDALIKIEVEGSLNVATKQSQKGDLHFFATKPQEFE
ncbi:9327_t:CDS:2 [Funneliformis caledonium]|uniref:9327_t:CDS:1 n=1 Tax=Funneliformis caledonium TaxID=1117310 RepID=A0A9N8WHR9_9GLOM|nr:9327_t:CDS:2 [Funneliformis caledonium]